ncbi:hypothetical protein D3C87_475590 [compost metagenome]
MDALEFLGVLSGLQNKRGKKVTAAAAKTYLRPNDLNERWGGAVTTGTLANWRSQGNGPAFVKFGTRVLYPLDEVERWEVAQLRGVNDNEKDPKK